MSCGYLRGDDLEFYCSFADSEDWPYNEATPKPSTKMVNVNHSPKSLSHLYFNFRVWR